MLYREYIFGGCAVRYLQTPEFGVGLVLLPADMPAEPDAHFCDSMVQARLRGARSLVDYSEGMTMRNSSSVLLRIEEQTADESSVVTRLSDGAGNEYVHTLGYDARTGVFSVWVEYRNRSGREQVLESLQSFSLSGIGVPRGDAFSDIGMKFVRMTSAWSRECRVKEDEFCDLGFDKSWAQHGVRCERFGQLGSMPNRGWFPFAAVEGGGCVWAAMLEAPFSWQIELYKLRETCALSGGLADYEFGHWFKKIADGASFSTHKAYIWVGRGNAQDACNAFVRFQDRRLLASGTLPESEQGMPVLFNEYCTTWGVPSEENILRILESIRNLPVEYFVIDAGWYKPDHCDWGAAMGDWNPSKSLFPHGIRAVADAIRQSGKKAGVWFEFEVAGCESEIYRREELFVTRDGVPLTTGARRFFDLRSGEVTAYLTRKMCDFLRENGFEYIKIDYNDSIGMGVDGAESLGEGGRQVAEESIGWLARLKDSVPGIVIENCASGGSRIEPLRMSRVSMCSFSDAHECKEIPLVAANVSRVIPARQSQIWAVIREADTPARIVWSLTAAMFGRICLSGDVHKITAEQMQKISEGLEFYSAAKDIVASGDIADVFCNIRYYRDPKGCQIYKKISQDKRRMLVLAHFFEEPFGACETDIAGYRLISAYTTLRYRAEGGVLRLEPEEYSAGAFLLEKEEED